MLLLDWRESGVAGLQPPTRRGFGRELIERALAYTLRAKTEMVFGEDGMTCRIEMPLPARPVEEPSGCLGIPWYRAAHALQGRRILVVEDDYLIALDLTDIL
jgi:hypothetical protein